MESRDEEENGSQHKEEQKRSIKAMEKGSRETEINEMVTRMDISES